MIHIVQGIHINPVRAVHPGSIDKKPQPENILVLLRGFGQIPQLLDLAQLVGNLVFPQQIVVQDLVHENRVAAVTDMVQLIGQVHSRLLQGELHCAGHFLLQYIIGALIKGAQHK
ncbi:hypothetical protein D3C75_1011590 [compost metagenome]